MSVHARIIPTAPAFRKGLRSLIAARAGRSDEGKTSPGGLTPHVRYTRAHSRTLVAKSTSAILPARPSSVNVGCVPAKTSSPVTPDGGVSPEYGKYDVTGTLNGAPAAGATISSERFASHRGKV